MATNFLWAAGTSNNGLLVAAITLLSTELNSLTSGSTVVSSVGGASGVFTNSNTSQGILASLFFNFGGTNSGSPSAAGSIAGWFLESLDGGTTFENSSTAQLRAPDFIFATPSTQIAGGSAPLKSIQPVILPALEFKVFVQNNTNANFAASGLTLKAAPYAMQY